MQAHRKEPAPETARKRSRVRMGNVTTFPRSARLGTTLGYTLVCLGLLILVRYGTTMGYSRRSSKLEN